MLDFLHDKPLEPGTLAPDFTLHDQDGLPVRLTELRGRNVVLIFYPMDETRVCRQQLCEFRDQSALWKAKNTEVFGVNPAGAEKHAGFRNRNNLMFPLLVDEGSHVAKLYHAKGFLVPLRTVYLIGPDGRIRYAKRGKPEPSEVLQTAVC